MDNDKILRRYTELPALIYLLQKRKLTLLDPKLWDDGNDSYFLSLYQQKKNLKTLLALCFTRANETYHHWRIFAGGTGGVCIRFKRKELIDAVKKKAGFRRRIVRYKTLPQIKEAKLAIADLPFLKRYAYGHEAEYRLLYESKIKNISSLDVDIPLSCIEGITLSPWIHDNLFDCVRQIVKSINGCDNMKVAKSTLIGNEGWKRAGDTAA